MDFRIVIDTREQHPYGFSCATERRKLDAGDYSVVGCESRIAVERKSLADFVHTVIHDADRFRAELEKLARCSLACVVVEADLDAVLRGLRQSDLRMVTPSAVLGAALHIAIQYRVPVQWCGSRQAACAFTEQYLRMAVREGAVSLPGVAHA
ncbi:MAG: ERCC4 domain-containing protein [Phycisphaerales bacterium]